MSDSTRKLYRAAAALLLLGMLSGIPLALAFAGKFAANAQYMLAAHLNAILGALILFAYAYSIQYSPFSAFWKLLAGLLMALSAYGNFIVTFVKSLLNVRGLEANGNPINDAVFIALNLIVVIPAIAGTAIWYVGLAKEL